MKRIIALTLMIVTIAVQWQGCTKPEQTGTIYGTVTDFLTGEPIKNASVKIKPSGEATLTGSDGTYQFQNLKPGSYSLNLSKAEYNDVDEDYVINLVAGGSVRRDVQMHKQIASLQITDMSGNPLPSLAFGVDESVTSKSFNIFNDGTLSVDVTLSYNCTWISNVIPGTFRVEPGNTRTVTVVIDRTTLLEGENTTYLHIISDNGSNELKVTANGGSKPTVTTSNSSNVTTTTAQCGGNVISDGGSTVTKRGICWAKTHNPDLSKDHSQVGSGTGAFSDVISNLEVGTTYYVRAYATNQRGTSYGQEVDFTTNNGIPTVTTIAPTRTGTTVVTGGNVESDEGFAVTARGVCYGLTPNPDISAAHNHTSNGSGTGTYSSTFEMNGTGIYHVRAYATNENGTSYGDDLPIKHPYNDLLSFTFNGHTYRVAPPASDIMTWTNANSYCENLTLYGYSDWRLPTLDELREMYNHWYWNHTSFNGFNSDYWWSSTSCQDNSQHMRVCFATAGSSGGLSSCSAGSHYVRPIRVE